MIDVKNLIYEYPGNRVIDDISFSIEEGSITAIVGPNGSGKSTLLECIAGLKRPYSGYININDVNIVKSPRAYNKYMGYLPTYYGLYDHLTILQNFVYFAAANKIPETYIYERSHEVAEQLLLNDMLDTKIGVLSRGFRQRVALGQAMIHKPKVLLLEKPLTGLDVSARITLLDLLLKLNNEGMTIMVASHDFDELEQYATNYLIIKDGKMCEHIVSSDLSDKGKLISFKTLIVPENILEIMESAERVSHVSVDNHTITFSFNGNIVAQRQLIKYLSTKDLEIYEFYIKSYSMIAEIKKKYF